ncbi:hypothetical protein KRE40_10360 [Elizabethkingia meningoseptica]|uniref:hypothetical protein n=1 Tax=Elizabethkingia meningoseptica TaxID=238 RepID=UPI0008415E04|nr:hypothetical protein [Elizabethkingia meningoseptica]MDE5436922.1 hypothetical protein [Elizabethkingia meningoseptica]MDE5509051.1 hypothetical protein [Elizabethkingia meningoseptica]MDE5514568.1 hypothetical protein [Elizabethkingia meningoseptica]MDE5525215.1 hypothetical protein [Elizabethkingia meningoseptica]MDE5528779.1 hypothetical protein [Elizabethkingia meningoseptica]
MKKILLIVAFTAAGLVSAAATSTKKSVKLSKKVKYFEIIKENGFAAYDTSDKGTCFVYGTYYTDTKTGAQFFVQASLTTQSTVVTPPCTGDGSYLV